MELSEVSKSSVEDAGLTYYGLGQDHLICERSWFTRGCRNYYHRSRLLLFLGRGSCYCRNWLLPVRGRWSCRCRS
jgi:hypothetical protein